MDDQQANSRRDRSTQHRERLVRMQHQLEDVLERWPASGQWDRELGLSLVASLSVVEKSAALLICELVGA